MSGFKARHAHDVFWLAGYAHRTMAPLFEELRAFEPTAVLYIEMVFGAANYSDPWHVDVKGHWKRHGMIVQQTCLSTTSGVDRTASIVRALIASLREEAAA